MKMRLLIPLDINFNLIQETDWTVIGIFLYKIVDKTQIY